MIKFIFEYIDDGVSVQKITAEMNQDSSLSDIVDTFEQWLRGVGYSFGKVEVYDNEGKIY